MDWTSGNGRKMILCGLILSLAVCGCGIKTRIKVPVSPAIAAAKTATLQELLSMIGEREAGIASLSSSSLKLTLTTEKAGSGELQKYHSAPGYVLLRSPSDIRLNVQNPVTKTTILELLSSGNRFEVWNPGKNTVYEGRNSAAGFVLDQESEALSFSARPIHIFEALLPKGIALDEPDLRISKTELQDAGAKYYLLTLYRETGSAEIHPLRQLWIERSQMLPAREDRFAETGEVVSSVRYANFAVFQGRALPRDVRIERPVDGYSLELHFKDWRINPSMEDSAFVLRLPPGAERVVLKEKGNSRP
jgi:outer membrane lipoprotein-sorting protein